MAESLPGEWLGRLFLVLMGIFCACVRLLRLAIEVLLYVRRK